jgi:hypothetical protein
MPTIKVQNSVAANGTVDNVLQGNQFEFLPYNAQLDFGVVAAAAGVVMDVYSGSDTLIEAGVVSAANRSPVFPDDFDLRDVAAAGERVKVRLRNTTGAAIIVNTTVRITPL